MTADLAAIAGLDAPARLLIGGSGTGREGGPDGLLEFTETKYIAVDW